MKFSKKLMSNKFLPVLAAYLLSSLLSVAVYADDSSRLLSKYDLNGDHSISQDEIMSKKLDVFRYLDSDKDGIGQL